MGFFKERKRAKELEGSYNIIDAFVKKIDGKNFDDCTPEEIQSLYDECESIMEKVAVCKNIVVEDLNRNMALLDNCWFATRDAIAYEVSIHRKRKQILDKDEAIIVAAKTKLIEKGAKQKHASQNTEESQFGL